MTITLLAPDGVAVTAQQERQAKAAQHGGGAGRPLGGRSGFRIDTPSNILTATSTTWTLGPCSAMIDPGASTQQGMYGWATDANISGAITPADPTYDRKDIVYIQINDSTAGDGSGGVSANVLYAAGPADGTLTPPALTGTRARSFLVGTITVPKAGGGSPTVVRNPSVYVAAGAPQPVSTQAERDALDKYVPLTVARLDAGGRSETWDGTYWTGAVTPAAGAGWALAGSMTRTRGASGAQIAAAFMCTYSGGAFGIGTTFIKALTLNNPGYIPSADVFGYLLVLSSTNVVRADGAFNINSAGEIYIRMFSGAYTIQPTDKFYISANWNA